jgi:glycerophosphoryl diester phosphodiesterase
MEIIAHRGASHDAPENTLAAVRLAWEQDADAVEVDVRLSSDGRLVLIHDPLLRRTGGVRSRVRDRTFSQLQRIDVGRWKGIQWAGETIPSLESAIETIPQNKRLLVEFKCGPEAIPEFSGILTRCGKQQEQIVPIGFSISTMSAINAAIPGLQVYWAAQLRRFGLQRQRVHEVQRLVEATKQAGLNGLDLRSSRRINRNLVRQVKGAGLGLFVWTVNSAAVARRLAFAGVDGITTDRPGWLKTKLGL